MSCSSFARIDPAGPEEDSVGVLLGVKEDFKLAFLRRGGGFGFVSGTTWKRLFITHTQ